MTVEIILFLLAFLGGYCLGRRLGRRAGFEEGKSIASLLLRQQSFEQGRCVLCRKTCRQNGSGAV